MSIIDQAIEILQKTNDGELLTRPDLNLVQIAANGNLSERGEVQFAKLHVAVADGTYAQTKRWFHDVEFLSQDHEGYVYWKGKQVEHYSYDDSVREAEAAVRLGERCRSLEEKGFPVNSRTTTNPDVYQAPADTPWLTALVRYYTFFKKNDQVMGIFYRMNVKPGEAQVIGAYKNQEGIQLIPYEGAYEGFHAAQADGWTSTDSARGYAETAELLKATGLTGEELDTIIKVA